MKLEKLVKDAFINRLGITPDRKAVEAFTRQFAARHKLSDLLEQATDQDYLAALKAVVAGREQPQAGDGNAAVLGTETADEKPKGVRKP